VAPGLLAQDVPLSPKGNTPAFPFVGLDPFLTTMIGLRFAPGQFLGLDDKMPDARDIHGSWIEERHLGAHCGRHGMLAVHEQDKIVELPACGI
jgi:hypothetical protein